MLPLVDFAAVTVLHRLICEGGNRARPRDIHLAALEVDAILSPHARRAQMFSQAACVIHHAVGSAHYFLGGLFVSVRVHHRSRLHFRLAQGGALPEERLAETRRPLQPQPLHECIVERIAGTTGSAKVRVCAIVVGSAASVLVGEQIGAKPVMRANACCRGECRDAGGENHASANSGHPSLLPTISASR